MRHGVKGNAAGLVLHVLARESAPSRAGFIVSRAVGPAVTRNRVKRQLRHLARSAFTTTSIPIDVVVRALPDAASVDLAASFEKALTRCQDRMSA